MKKLLLSILALTLLGGLPAQARELLPNPAIHFSEPNEAGLQSHRQYVNRDSQTVHSPSKSKTGKAPNGASARCRDGSFSFSHHRRGTCSHHGGVGTWLQGRVEMDHRAADHKKSRPA